MGCSAARSSDSHAISRQPLSGTRWNRLTRGRASTASEFAVKYRGKRPQCGAIRFPGMAARRRADRHPRRTVPHRDPPAAQSPPRRRRGVSDVESRTHEGHRAAAGGRAADRVEPPVARQVPLSRSPAPTRIISMKYRTYEASVRELRRDYNLCGFAATSADLLNDRASLHNSRTPNLLEYYFPPRAPTLLHLV